MSDKTLISFDYAIKYLLRDKSDYDIVEGFISSLLATAGYSSVKIKSLLESESNREKQKAKRSVADMIVEDQKGEKYIIEIEREPTLDFAQKACFNSCRLIVDEIGSGTDYRAIKKVIHISLLYFVGADMKHPLYHGKTIIREIDTDHPLNLCLGDMKGHTFQVHNIFPEYFFICIPLFDDHVQKDIDEWLYMMKHSEIKEEFKAPAMQKAGERLKFLKMNDEERNNYYAYMKERVHIESAINFAKEEGLEKGKAEGRLEERKAMIKQLHTSGMDIEAIQKVTQIPQEELKGILEQ